MGRLVRTSDATHLSVSIELIAQAVTVGVDAADVTPYPHLTSHPTRRTPSHGIVAAMIFHPGCSSAAFDIILAPAAATALKSLAVPIRRAVMDALDVHVTHEPTKVSKSRIKRLRGLSQPQYRLRVGDIRMFDDVTGDASPSPRNGHEGRSPIVAR